MPSAVFATGFCETRLLTSPMAVQALRGESDGRWIATVDYSTAKPGLREIELPAALTELAGQPNMRVLVLAGNSGDIYEGTRHSLAYAFGDYLLRTYPARLHLTGDVDYVSRETVSVTYDDQTQRTWTTDFHTEAPYARTSSGEIFYFPNISGAPVLVVKMIGDYNGVGDFAIPILDALNLSAKNLLLVHDDLDLTEGQIEMNMGVQEYNGDNAVFSLIRSLAYGALPLAEAYLKSMADLPEKDWQDYESAFRIKADVRYRGHLGQPRVFAGAFKSVDTVLAGLISVIPKVVNKATVVQQTELTQTKAKISELKRPLGSIMPDLKNPGLPADRRSQLEARRDEINAAAKVLYQRVMELDAEIEAVRSEITASIRAIVEERLSFNRLAVGTDDGTFGPKDAAAPEALRDYVLAPYPQSVFNDNFWVRADGVLRPWFSKASRP